MSESARPGERNVWSLVWRVGVAVAYRLYALALVVTIAYLSFLAFQYLWLSLMTPAAASQRVTDVPSRLTGSSLKTSREEWRGLEDGDAPRAPLAHYHRINSWLQPDFGNNCTTSGCHSPIPHARRKEDRAFLNLHSTSVHCGVCHMTATEKPLNIVWYDLKTQKVSSPPTLLQAYALVMRWASQSAKPSDEDRRDLVELLRTAVTNEDASSEVRSLYDHLVLVRAESEDFSKLIEHAATLLPRHLRGEYGRKLALAQGSEPSPVLGHPNTELAVKRFQERGSVADAAERKSLLDAVHPRRRPTPLTCHDCHAESGVVDFAELGYPPDRIRALTNRPFGAMIERIIAGQPFHMPTILEGSHEP